MNTFDYNTSDYKFYKYPRTNHLQGSGFQKGDEDLESVPFEQIKGQYLVIEEKLDGANSGISFDDEGNLLIQSRGHILRGGWREQQFNLLKSWATTYQDMFFDLLSNRYIMYGEWVFAKHTLFYDALPHYFMEFDIFDKKTEIFLSTRRRHMLLKDQPIISVPVLKTGCFERLEDITSLIGDSLYKTDELENSFVDVVKKTGINLEKAKQETDLSSKMEGLYIKQEDDDQVLDRMKYIRSDFLNTISESGTHWMDRPIIPNQLANGIDIFKV